MTEDSPTPSQSPFVPIPPLSELGSSQQEGPPRAHLILLSRTPSALPPLMTMWLPLGLSPVPECRGRGGAPCPHDASIFTQSRVSRQLVWELLLVTSNNTSSLSLQELGKIKVFSLPC